jgi:hypothetical protein
MPIHGPTTLDAVHLDSVLTLDVDSGMAEIDLSRASFVDAYALTGLACFIASADRDGLSVELVPPEDPNVRSWLSRMHLGAVVDAFQVHVRGGLPRVAERDRSDTLIELRRFDDSHGSHRLASFIWDRLQGGADAEVVNQIFEAAGELGQNVVEHAGSPVGGFVAAQRYKAGAPEERIIVAVGDAGIGVRESLRPRYGRRRGQGARRCRLDPQRCGLENDHAAAGDPYRRVSPARYDCRCSVALPARRVTREEARSNSVDTHRPEAGIHP